MDLGGKGETFIGPIAVCFQQRRCRLPVGSGLGQQRERRLLLRCFHDVRLGHVELNYGDIPIEMKFVGAAEHQAIGALIVLKMTAVAVGIDEISLVKVSCANMQRLR